MIGLILGIALLVGIMAAVWLYAPRPVAIVVCSVLAVVLLIIGLQLVGVDLSGPRIVRVGD